MHQGLSSLLLSSLIVLANVVAGRSSSYSPSDETESLRGLQAIQQTYTKLEHIPESLLGDAECQLTKAAYKGTILQSGLHNKAHSIHDCREQCQKHANCTAWFYCQDAKKCADEQDNWLPEKGCQLKAEARQPWGIPQGEGLHSRPSTYASGYVKRRSASQRTFIRQHSAPSTSMILGISMHPDGECRDDHGPEMQQLTLMSRQDYARWHSYELHVVTQGVPGIPKDKTGQYNKIAFVKKLLEETDPSVAEWILYCEPEMVIDDPAFTFPFEFYAGRDIVLVGDPVKMRAGDPKSVDTGTFLIRNSERSKALINQIADVADQFQDGSQYDPVALALLHLVQQDGHTWMSHLHFEHEFCLDCDWKRVDLAESGKTEITKVWGDQNTRWKLFITRFFNCEVCYGRMDKQGLGQCQQSFREHFEFASCRAHRLAAAVTKEGETGVPLQHLSEMVSVQGFDSDRWVAAQPKDNEVVQQSTVRSAQACYQACAGQKQCDFWVWCNQASGCDHNHAFDGRYPFQSCSLIHLHRGLSPYEWQRGPQASTFASGYIGPEHSSRSGDPSAAAKQVVTLTGIPTAPCSTPWGDHLISLATQNKQDWARLHGHELHLMAASTDVRIRPGAWQKVALLRQALSQIPRERAEWVVWIDMDVMLGDIGFTFPLTKEAYADKDLIVWGNYDAVLAGDTYNGLNGGIMLFRNSDWSRRFLDDVAHFGQFPPNMTTEQVLQTSLPSYDIGMFEQNAAVYVLMQTPELMANVFFEHDYCINCWYKDLDSPLILQPAFVVHFAGCQMCSGLHAEKIGACAAIYVRMFAEAFARLLSLATMNGL